MIQDINNLLREIKDHIVKDDDLSYIEDVVIRKYTKNSLPNFQNYAVIVSPESFGFHSIANRVRQETDTVDIVCVVRNYNEEVSLIGTAPAPGMGIIKMAGQVHRSLFNFSQAKKEEMEVHFNELNETVNINTHKFPQREGFFHEVIITYRVRLKPTTF